MFKKYAIYSDRDVLHKSVKQSKSDAPSSFVYKVYRQMNKLDTPY